jgi:hypothetical protein
MSLLLEKEISQLSEAPVLILAYNRPDQIRGLIDSMRPYAPKSVLIAIDGPKGTAIDSEKVRKVVEEVEGINWTDDVQILERKSNLGLRLAVPEAVTWAISKVGRVIVVEDDVRVSKDFFPYLNYCLQDYKREQHIGSISGYNPVPKKFITNSNVRSRASLFPESYAWATWERAWSKYEDEMSWARGLDLERLREMTGSIQAAMAWKMNFYDAYSGAISTWAYRWVASLWRHNLLSISPNVNLIDYRGLTEGTHTRGSRSWEELETEEIMQLDPGAGPSLKMIDELADNWLAKNIFRSTNLGVVRRAAESFVLNALRPKK